MEVMGLMLGEFVDEYTIIVKDVFAMPQSGTTVSVESVDPVFQTNMLDMLRQTNRVEMVIGWYHSHPGFGCWLSSVDVNTQQSFESLNSRAVAVVIDPIQSVRGKVVIDAFRTIGGYPMTPRSQSREHTSNEGFLNRPTIQALIHGLNKAYYSINIKYKKTKVDELIMLSLFKNRTDGLLLQNFEDNWKKNECLVKEMLKLAKNFNAQIEAESSKSKEEIEKRRIGFSDPKVHLINVIEKLNKINVDQTLGSLYNYDIF